MSQVQTLLAQKDSPITPARIDDFVAQTCPAKDYSGRRVLLIVPDATRSAPIGPFFRALHHQIAPSAAAFDVMVALGTHQPMSEKAICQRIGITPGERETDFRSVQLLNHEWDNPSALRTLGSIPAEEITALSGGLFSMDVEVKINARIFDYDQLIIVGPVFPHEVVGFSGGNKYLFPGRRGPGNPQLLPLAGRRDHQSNDHREQVDAGPEGRGSRRANGANR